ncbi:MAG TPA: efflux RND transporter periplasmic adaptor subunit [Thermoanaerobaculia bacterium]|nr:efflux RND transporter periplasmic adaptor subunit [Thermoanaerobaculia bacterium]
MKRKGVVVLVVLLLVAGAAALWWYVIRQRRAEPLALSGAIEANTVEVGSLLGGRVAAVQVREGDRVSAGQPLVTFESALPDLELAQQRAVVAQAEAELARVRRGPRPEELQQARIAWQSAETDRRRFEALWKAGIVSRRDYDATEVKAATALEAQRAAERGGRPEDVAAAVATVTQQQKRLEFLARQHQELVVTAPKAGVVEVLDLRPGDLVAADQPVATLLEPDQIWVRVFVPETQLGRVRLGQPAAIRVDTFPHRAFPGRVVEIRTQGEYTPRNVQTLEQRADQVFGVKVAIEPRPELKPGMAATVTLAEPGAAPSPTPRPETPLQ